MGVKYILNYRDEFNQRNRVEIATEAYSGVPISLRGVQGQACVFTYDCPDDPYEPIVNSKAAINIYQQEGNNINILELQQAQDREFTVRYYFEDVLKWAGFLTADGTQQPWRAAPFDFTLTATDGLMLLDGIDYTNSNLTGGRTIINYFRNILFADANLGLPLAIKWINTLKNLEYPLEDDVFSGSVKWANNGEGFNDYNGTVKSCLYILENILRSMQCRIYQGDGKWNIERINDKFTGEYIYRETPATLIGMIITTSDPQYDIKSIGRNNTGFDYRFIEEDAVVTVLPGYKSVATTYDQDQRENILPNGSMDLVNSLTNEPFYWQLTLGGSVESVPSIFNDKGFAAKVTSTNTTGKYFELIGELPIDSDLLYETMTIGFKFLPVSGFPVDGDGLIIWTSPVFLYVVSFNDNDGNTWYLNEFGFWVDTFVSMIPTPVDQLKLGDVAQVDFNKFQNIPLIIPANVPIGQTTPPSIKISFFIPEVCEIIFDDVYVNVQSNSDVYLVENENTKNTDKKEYNLRISSSHNGFYISNFMTDYESSGLEKFFTDARHTGTLTEINSHAIMRNRYKSSLIMDTSIYGASWKYGDIYNIQNLPSKNFLPLKASWNTEKNTTLLTLIEVRDDDVTLKVTQYPKNLSLQSN